MKDAIGAPVPRKEDLRLITGRGTYVSDLQPARTRHVAFLRSPHAHAGIGAVDGTISVTEATAADGKAMSVKVEMRGMRVALSEVTANSVQSLGPMARSSRLR